MRIWISQPPVPSRSACGHGYGTGGVRECAGQPRQALRLCCQTPSERLGLDVGQYVSLALYLSPPPELTPNVDLTQLPPQASAVVNVLPLLRSFAELIDLHFIWLKHRPEYEALTARVHDPMTDMILETNLYLHQPVSTFDGRRFLVLLEPMLSPSLTNARVYGYDYIIVMSPDNSGDGRSGEHGADSAYLSALRCGTDGVQPWCGNGDECSRCWRRCRMLLWSFFTRATLWH